MWRTAIISGFACLISATSFAGSDLPIKPIQKTNAALCGNPNLIPDYSDCRSFARTNEPAQPVTRWGKTRLAFRLTYAEALESTFIARVEIISEDEGYLQVYGMGTRLDDVPLSGRTLLTNAEISKIAHAAVTSGFWSVPSILELPAETKLPDGRTEINVCADGDGMSLEGFSPDAQHAVSRSLCPFNQADHGLVDFAKVIAVVSKAHFPDLPIKGLLDD